jgi:cytoskeletal protein RodZ
VNAADLARLELAKRAYRATEPNETEVQRGVRRTRLALQRPKQRRRWFGKGLVMVVLAVGSLAYAKPHAVLALISNALESSQNQGKQPAARGVAATLKLPEPAAPLQLPAAAPSEPASPSEPSEPSATPAAVETTKSTARGATKRAVPAVVAAPSAEAAPEKAPSAPAAGDNVSDWGRVGQALAQGDESKALAVLSKLSGSEDPRTRDKADLGRAQLLLSHGESERGCALARELTHRRAGSRIERQAQALLKSCSR